MSFLKACNKNSSLAVQLVIFVALILGGLVLGTVFGIICSYFPTSANMRLEWAQLVASTCVFIIPAIIAAYLFGTNAGANKTRSTHYLLGTMLIVCALPIINLLTSWNEAIRLPEAMRGVENFLKMMEENARRITDLFLLNNSWGGWIFNLIVMALVPAIGEELTFRGILQPMFAKKWGDHAGVWITAIVFSAIHMQFYGFIPRLLLGVLFGYLVVWSGSIYTSMVAHFVNNALVVCAYFVMAHWNIEDNVEALGIGNQWPIAIGSAAIVIAIMFLVWKRRVVKEGDDAHEL